MNKRKIIPISEMLLINSMSWINFKPIGPRTRPAIMYAGIKGCLKSLERYAKNVAVIRIMPRLNNRLCGMKLNTSSNIEM
jgi:hypothetical protein